MGFFDKLFGGKSKDENTAKFTNQSKTVLTPLQGKVLAQADIPDETFAQGILGPGCGIEPTGDTVYAPFDGTVTQIATTLHAVGITSNDGIELLIHVGMDTVEMNGKGFKALVKELQALCLDIKVLDAQGEEIELRDDEEEGYQNINQIRDDDYEPYREDADAQFSAAGYTIKESSDDDDLTVGDDSDSDTAEDDYGDGDYEE